MSNDYKNTLNLPVTDFPMKANLGEREPKTLKFWEEMDVYVKLRALRTGAKKFVLCDGPPYANGHLHLGHALNKTLKDIIVKSKSLSGYDAPFVPGWDCHGLPIELNVEKNFGKAGDAISAHDFRIACRRYAESQIDIQRQEFKRLGVMGDWKNPYRTMDYAYEADIIRVLAKIAENGFLTQGFKPVHWCFDCGSALAEAEVEFASKVSPAIDVAFRVAEKNKLLDKLKINSDLENISVAIWTTTPWTLPANVAVAVGEDINYVLVQTEKGGLILAEALYETCLQRYHLTAEKVLSRFSGKELEGLLLNHPFYDRKASVVLGEHVTVDTGTGAVHIAPAHGVEDFVVAKKYNLPLLSLINKKGVFLEDVPLFAKQFIFKANDAIIEELKNQGNLLAFAKVEHSYPHCWRHKTALIFLATPQWFINLQENYRDHALDAAKQVYWYPNWGLTNISSMIENRPDWCISRQRNWGTPITIFVHKETQKPHPETISLMYKIADKVEKEGLETWFESSTEEWLGGDAKDYEKIVDVLDVWFDAGVAHYAVLKKRNELHFPADVILEGSDQYRGWFQSMLLTAIGMQKEKYLSPYRTAITHGFTVDEQGRKMSKSIGNVIAPEKIWNTMGADILRLWVSSTDYTREVALSNEILKRLSDTYRRIRNTARYYLSNLFDFDPEINLVAPDKMLSLDRWAVERASYLQKEIIAAYDRYDFDYIYQALHNFCIVDMGGFYLDIIKDRQYTMQKNSLGRRSAQTALFHIAEAMVRWLMPILSFTAEEIWKYMPGRREQSVLMTTWYENLISNNENDPLANYDRQKFWWTMQQIRDVVNKEIENARNEGQVGSSLEAEVQIFCDPNSKLMQILTALENELRFVFITSKATISGYDHQQDLAPTNIDGEEIWIKISSINAQKCVRCWHRSVEIGQDPSHPELCLRCVENVVGEGEVRKFA